MSIDKSIEYKELIGGIKTQIKNSRQKTLLSVNRELLILYWNIGNIILSFQNKEGWGAKVIDNIADEIKTSNFMEKLDSPNNTLAVEVLKDPYIFDFISMTEEMNERDIEKQLVKKVTKLLLELGSGFAFIGNQYKLNVGGDDYYLDLLFYNLKLRCYVVIELKTGKFKPEYAGKLKKYSYLIIPLLLIFYFKIGNLQDQTSTVKLTVQV